MMEACRGRIRARHTSFRLAGRLHVPDVDIGMGHNGHDSFRGLEGRSGDLSNGSTEIAGDAAGFLASPASEE